MAGPARMATTAHPLLGRRLIAAVREQVFEAQMSVHRPAMLADHKIQGKVIMPGAAYLEMALAAGAALHDHGIHGARALVRPRHVAGGTALVGQDAQDRADDRHARRSASGQRPHRQPATRSTGYPDDGKASRNSPRTPSAISRQPTDAKSDVVDLEAIRARFTGEARDAAWREEALRKSGLEPGPTFSWLVLHWTNPQEALGQLRPPCEADRAGQYQIHPGLLDSVLQLLGSILPGAGTGIDAYVPMAFERLQCFAIPQGPLWALATLTSFDGKLAVGNVDLIDEQGQVVVKMEGASLRRVSRDWIARLAAGPLPDWCYELAWTSQPLSAAAVDETAVEPAHWLIFDSHDGVGAALAERLGMKAHECTLVPAGTSCEARQTAVAGVPCRAGARAARDRLSAGAWTWRAIRAVPDFAAARRDGWGAALDLVHALTTSGKAKPPRLWLVTRGAHAAGEASPLALAQSPIWGLGRVIAAEHPELGCTRIDLDPAVAATRPTNWRKRSGRDNHEDQVAYRGGERLVARLRRLDHVEAGSLQVPRGRPYRLEITSRGQLDNVALQPANRQARDPARSRSRSAPRA